MRLCTVLCALLSGVPLAAAAGVDTAPKVAPQAPLNKNGGKEFQNADAVPGSQGAIDAALDPALVVAEAAVVPKDSKKGNVVLDDYDPNNLGADARKEKSAKEKAAANEAALDAKQASVQAEAAELSEFSAGGVDEIGASEVGAGLKEKTAGEVAGFDVGLKDAAEVNAPKPANAAPKPAAKAAAKGAKADSEPALKADSEPAPPKANNDPAPPKGASKAKALAAAVEDEIEEPKAAKAAGKAKGEAKGAKNAAAVEDEDVAVGGKGAKAAKADAKADAQGKASTFDDEFEDAAPAKGGKAKPVVEDETVADAKAAKADAKAAKPKAAAAAAVDADVEDVPVKPKKAGKGSAKPAAAGKAAAEDVEEPVEEFVPKKPVVEVVWEDDEETTTTTSTTTTTTATTTTTTTTTATTTTATTTTTTDVYAPEKTPSPEEVAAAADKKEEIRESTRRKIEAMRAEHQAAHPDHDDGNGESRFSLFVGAMLMIVVSEIGDKTFFIAALMAMRHPPVYVFSSSYSAMVLMTVLSMFIGLVLPSLLSKSLSTLLATILFLVFGIRLFREALHMDQALRATEELEEVQQSLAQQDDTEASEKAEGGGVFARRGRHVRPWRRYTRTIEGLLNSPWAQIFAMTFLGEWGDRSQIATVAMGSGVGWTAVLFGCLMGHLITTIIAVMGGHILASKLSLRTITFAGAFCFLAFAFTYFREWLSL